MMDAEVPLARIGLLTRIRADFEFFRACCDGRWDVALLSYGLPAVILYRFGHAINAVSARVVRWPMLFPYHLFRVPVELILGIQIARTAEISGPIMIHHYGQIFIAAGVRMGSRCQVFQGVTIGESGGSRAGRPVIGDRVLLGAGAKVLGKISVGDDARIGANAVVVDDVPAGAVAVGVPAVIKTRGA
jgi:serine O-acetyltransferase